MNLYETHNELSLSIPHRLCREQGQQSDPPCMAPDNSQKKSGMIYAKVCQAVVQYEGLLSHLAVRIVILTSAGAELPC